MKNFKISKKFLITFGIIIAMFLITVIVSIISLTGVQERFNDFFSRSYEVRAKVMDMMTDVNSIGKNIGYATMVEEKTETENYINQAKKEVEEIFGSVDYLKENFRGDMNLVDSFNSSMKSIESDRDEVFDLALQNKNTEASELYFKNVYPTFIEARDFLSQVADQAKENATNNYEIAESQANLTVIVLIILSVAVLIVTVGLALYLTKSLTTPINEIEKAALNMAKGDFNISVNYDSKDELGELSDNVRGMTSSLKLIINDIGSVLSELSSGNFTVSSSIPDEYVGGYAPILKSMVNLRDTQSQLLRQINESANQVASGSEQVSYGAQSLSQGATEQASSIQQLAATITEISNQIKINAENAHEASEAAKLTGEQMVESNRSMKDMINAIEDISKSSNEIGNIIKTIEDIAFQTNILALNATVEAARAGEAGKGFAVVADEVRNLANKSAEASQNTSILIENSVRSVKAGTKIASETAQALLVAVEGSKKIEETITHISDASNKQANAVEQVTQGIDQISSVVQTNSATAEESAAASEQLSSQAQVLKNLVGRFRLMDAEMNAGYLYRKGGN